MEPDGLATPDTPPVDRVDGVSRRGSRRLRERRSQREKLPLDRRAQTARLLGPNEGALPTAARPVRRLPPVRTSTTRVVRVLVAATAGARRTFPVGRHGFRMRVMEAAPDRRVRKHGRKRERSDEAIHECLRLENVS